MEPQNPNQLFSSGTSHLMFKPFIFCSGGSQLLLIFQGVNFSRPNAKAILAIHLTHLIRQTSDTSMPKHPKASPRLRPEAVVICYPPGNGYISHQTGKGKSSTQNAFLGDMLVFWRVHVSRDSPRLFRLGKNLGPNLAPLSTRQTPAIEITTWKAPFKNPPWRWKHCRGTFWCFQLGWIKTPEKKKPLGYLPFQKVIAAFYQSISTTKSNQCESHESFCCWLLDDELHPQEVYYPELLVSGKVNMEPETLMVSKRIYLARSWKSQGTHMR